MVCISSLLLGTLALATATVTASEQMPLDSAPKAAPACDCNGTTYLDATYVCGDWRLGPKLIPVAIPINVTSIGFKRYGGLCPGDFLAKYWNSAGRGSWNWPPMDGYQAKTDGNPLNGNLTLAPGLLVDRFGAPTGSYIAPFTSPFEQRALPPSSLNPAPNRTDLPEIYWVYEITKPLTVSGGTIAGWFGQPGLGTQFKTPKSIADLVTDGYLKWRPWKEIFGDPDTPSWDENLGEVLEL